MAAHRPPTYRQQRSCPSQYIIGCRETREAAFVDCGEPPERFLSWAEKHGCVRTPPIDLPRIPVLTVTAAARSFNITKILITHGHPDHVAGLSHTKKAIPDAEICIHPLDVETLRAATAIGSVRGHSTFQKKDDDGAAHAMITQFYLPTGL